MSVESLPGEEWKDIPETLTAKDKIEYAIIELFEADGYSATGDAND